MLFLSRAQEFERANQEQLSRLDSVQHTNRMQQNIISDLRLEVKPLPQSPSSPLLFCILLPPRFCSAVRPVLYYCAFVFFVWRFFITPWLTASTPPPLLANTLQKF